MKNLDEMRSELHDAWQRSTYDGHHGPAHVRHAAWLRLLEKIEEYAHELVAQAVDAVLAPTAPEQQPETSISIEVTPATEDHTSTIEVSTPSHAKAARRTQSRRSAR